MRTRQPAVVSANTRRVFGGTVAVVGHMLRIRSPDRDASGERGQHVRQVLDGVDLEQRAGGEHQVRDWRSLAGPRATPRTRMTVAPLIGVNYSCRQE